MNILRGAGESLLRCEHELRDLGARALQEGEYEAARRITALAELLAERRLRDGLEESMNMRTKQVAAPDLSSSAATQVSTGNGRIGTLPKSTSKYPRFMRRGDKLVKVGWSKKHRREYEHTTPWTAVLAFAAHLRAHARPGRIFKVDDLLPVTDAESQTELPDYQVYLALAWFREAGLVEKRGRRGYVPEPSGLDAPALEQRWATLPSRDV